MKKTKKQITNIKEEIDEIKEEYIQTLLEDNREWYLIKANNKEDTINLSKLSKFSTYELKNIIKRIEDKNEKGL